MALTLTCPAFSDGERIPVAFTQDGSGESPALRWEDAPAGTACFALIVDDPDAPTAEPFVHWVLYDIPADIDHLEEDVARGRDVSSPRGARQGPNSYGREGYDGPGPPRGHGTHRYVFRLCALGDGSDLPPGLDKRGLLKAAEGRILAETTLVGTYSR